MHPILMKEKTQTEILRESPKSYSLRKILSLTIA